MQVGEKYIGRSCENHTNILEEIEVLSIKKHFEGSRMVSYVYYKVMNNGYPARNGGFLDGLVGCTKLRGFKAKYIQVKSFQDVRFILEYNELLKQYGKKRLKSVSSNLESYLYLRIVGNYSLDAIKQTLKL